MIAVGDAGCGGRLLENRPVRVVRVTVLANWATLDSRRHVANACAASCSLSVYSGPTTLQVSLQVRACMSKKGMQRLQSSFELES